jgi:hypothetical protein
MRNFSILDSTDIIDVILFKYNYYDNKIWTGVKNQIDYIDVDNQSILVSPKELKKYIENTYPNEINKFRSIGSEFLHKDANSIYFISMMLKEMSRLKWIKLTLDKSKNYSRMIDNKETGKRITFSFKVLHVTFRLFEMFDDEELKNLNVVLKKLNILYDNKPYHRHKLVNVLNRLDRWVEEQALNSASAHIVEPILILLDSIEEKLEGDNPEVLIVTDY